MWDEIATVFQRWHADYLADKVKKNEEVLRAKYDKISLAKETTVVPETEVTKYREKTLSSKTIDTYVAKCRKVIKDYEFSLDNVCRFEYVENKIDALFPLEFYKDVLVSRQGFCVYQRRISKYIVEYKIAYNVEYKVACVTAVENKEDNAYDYPKGLRFKNISEIVFHSFNCYFEEWCDQFGYQFYAPDRLACMLKTINQTRRPS